MTSKSAFDDDFDPAFDADTEFAPADDFESWRQADSLTAGVQTFGDLDVTEPLAGAALAHPLAHFEAPPSPPQATEPAAAVAAAPMTAAADEPAYAPPASGEANVPRITIHIFCDRADTAAIAEQACADRRMSRAAVSIGMGGVAAAIDRYRSQPTPSLVIVEGLQAPAELLDQLDQLAEVCDPGTKVVVIGRANDIALYRELMRRGVSEYVVPPFNPLDFIQTITSLYADPSAPFLGRSVAFVGAKGGVGASTIAHNFAHALTEHMQTNAVIVDLDLPFGTAGLDFNQDPLQGVADALTQLDRLDPVLLERMMARCTDKLSLFAAPATLDDDYEISADAFEEVASKVRTIAPFVVLDLPHLWSGWMRRMLLSSDDVVIVATPDLASLRNAKNMVDLVKQARPNDEPPRLVLNQVGVQGRPEIPVKDFGDALDLTPALVVGFDPKLFGLAANNGQMVAQVNAKSKAVEGFQHLAQQISRREPPPPVKRSGLASLFKVK